MMYQGMYFESVDDAREYVFDQATNESWSVAQEEGVEDADYDEFVEAYIEKALDEFEKSSG